MEPHGFLEPDDAADAAVLQLVKRRCAELSLKGPFVTRAQLRHAQQAPDMVGAERRPTLAHRQLHLAKASPIPGPAGVRYQGVYEIQLRSRSAAAPATPIQLPISGLPAFS